MIKKYEIIDTDDILEMCINIKSGTGYPVGIKCNEITKINLEKAIYDKENIDKTTVEYNGEIYEFDIYEYCGHDIFVNNDLEDNCIEFSYSWRWKPLDGYKMQLGSKRPIMVKLNKDNNCGGCKESK